MLPRVPVIYQLPKIHKNPSKPPRRPIVSGVDSLFARIGEYLDSFFQPLAQSCPAYLKDSRDLIQLLQGIEVSEEHLLVSIDVNSLYTNIQQKHAIEVVVWALNNTNMEHKQKDFLVHALDLAMSHNFFWHDKNCFLGRKKEWPWGLSMPPQWQTYSWVTGKKMPFSVVTYLS